MNATYIKTSLRLTTKTRIRFLAALYGLGFLIPAGVHAEEGGSGHYLPGAMSSFVDAVSAKEAFIARYNLLYYNGSVAANQPLPIAAEMGAHAASFKKYPPKKIGLQPQAQRNGFMRIHTRNFGP